MPECKGLIPAHGGYQNLKGFQLAQLIYDVTVRFCNRYIDPRSRTHDQMVQAARSGKQNIGEGSVASGTSKKTELKLTNIARASLEELRLDYRDFLRQRSLREWPPNHPALLRFKARRCATLEEVRAWVQDERRRSMAVAKTRTGTDLHGRTRTGPISSAELVANAALSLLNICCYLIRRQIASLEEAFLEEGGFTERLYRVRTEHRTRRRSV
jgi:four helix bundle suffix protein